MLYMDYRTKYIKYKTKYLQMMAGIKQTGGNYSCYSNQNRSATRKIKEFCYADPKGKYKTFEDCAFSEECVSKHLSRPLAAESKHLPRPLAAESTRARILSSYTKGVWKLPPDLQSTDIINYFI